MLVRRPKGRGKRGVSASAAAGTRVAVSEDEEEDVVVIKKNTGRRRKGDTGGAAAAVKGEEASKKPTATRQQHQPMLSFGDDGEDGDGADDMLKPSKARRKQKSAMKAVSVPTLESEINTQMSAAGEYSAENLAALRKSSFRDGVSFDQPVRLRGALGGSNSLKEEGAVGATIGLADDSKGGADSFIPTAADIAAARAQREARREAAQSAKLRNHGPVDTTLDDAAAPAMAVADDDRDHAFGDYTSSRISMSTRALEKEQQRAAAAAIAAAEAENTGRHSSSEDDMEPNLDGGARQEQGNSTGGLIGRLISRAEVLRESAAAAGTAASRSKSRAEQLRSEAGSDRSKEAADRYSFFASLRAFCGEVLDMLDEKEPVIKEAEKGLARRLKARGNSRIATRQSILDDAAIVAGVPDWPKPVDDGAVDW